MKFCSELTDSAILQELGGRLAAERIKRNQTQASLAEQAGVSKRTIERLESGETATHLSGFVRVCRALGLLERFEAFLPESTPGPMAQLKFRNRRRQRASGKRLRTVASKNWTWGESQ